MTSVLRPGTLREAIAAVADGAVPLGGALEVIASRPQGTFVALKAIPGLTSVGVEPGQVRIGAACTLHAVATDVALHRSVPVLAQAAGLISNHRVRRQATVGGGLCTSSLRAELPALLAALDAEVVVHAPDGARRVPALGFEPRRATIITEVIVPLAVLQRATYLRFVARASEEHPCLGVAAALLDGHLRVVITGATASPFALPDVPARLADTGWRARIAADYERRIDPVSDVRGSAAYRRRLTRELVGRALARLAQEGKDMATAA